MTTVTFRSEGGRITGFEMEGHSGFAPQGEDLVCAALTSAVRLTECTVNDVLGLEASVKVREKDAYLSLKLPSALDQTNESIAQALLAGFMVHCVQLAEEYPENISVMEV
ncbi:MAG: ribosomal-processing cysteine protease Prp [Lawsonibacter sp.]|nr:ribosomal-processing cysteine protease Prp [Lawsonibacter sp.]